MRFPSPRRHGRICTWVALLWSGYYWLHKFSPMARCGTKNPMRNYWVKTGRTDNPQKTWLRICGPPAVRFDLYQGTQYLYCHERTTIGPRFSWSVSWDDPRKWQQFGPTPVRGLWPRTRSCVVPQGLFCGAYAEGSGCWVDRALP